MEFFWNSCFLAASRSLSADECERPWRVETLKGEDGFDVVMVNKKSNCLDRMTVAVRFDLKTLLLMPIS